MSRLLLYTSSDPAKSTICNLAYLLSPVSESIVATNNVNIQWDRLDELFINVSVVILFILPRNNKSKQSLSLVAMC